MKSLNILGLNYSFHDTTACIVVDGKIVVAIEEERLTREKHTTPFHRKPSNVVCPSLASILRTSTRWLFPLNHPKIG